MQTDLLSFAAQDTVGEVLQACRARNAQPSTLLVTQVEGAYRVCSLGSLLLYLTGQTPHIVHGHGRCPICSGVGLQLWRDAVELLTRALADPDACARRLADLPLARIPAIRATKLAEDGVYQKLAQIGFSACAVTEGEALRGILIFQHERSMGGLLPF